MLLCCVYVKQILCIAMCVKQETKEATKWLLIESWNLKKPNKLPKVKYYIAGINGWMDINIFDDCMQ